MSYLPKDTLDVKYTIVAQNDLPEFFSGLSSASVGTLYESRPMVFLFSHVTACPYLRSVVKQLPYKVINIKQSKVRTWCFRLCILCQIAEVLTVATQHVTAILTNLNPWEVPLFLFVVIARCECDVSSDTFCAFYCCYQAVWSQFITSLKIKTNRFCNSCWLLLQRCGTMRFLAHVQRVVAVAWCDEVRSK